MKDRKASSQAAWALLTEGVAEARVHAHRLRHLVDRSQSLVDAASSEDQERLYRAGGDIISGVPKRLEELERVLDRTSYALTKMGQDFLRGRIDIDDRTKVEEAVKSSLGFSPGMSRSSEPNPSRVVERYARRQER